MGTIVDGSSFAFHQLDYCTYSGTPKRFVELSAEILSLKRVELLEEELRDFKLRAA